MALDLFKLLGTIEVDNSKANKALDETSNKGSETQSKLSKAFGAVGRGAAVVGKTIVTGLAVGGTAFAGLTAKALSASGELEQNMGGSEAVFGKYATKMQDTAKNAFSNMGLSTSDYLATANKMGALFQGAGFDIEESMNLSSDAMQRAADVASIMGIDTGAAMEAIAGAAKGNFTMMDNLGVAMNDTTLQAYALEKGINKSTTEMTNQEKIGLAMEMFMEKTAYAAGNYAKENETLAGSLGTAKSALSNFLDGSGSVEDLVSSFGNLAKVAVKSLQEILPRLTTGLTDIVNQIMPMLPPLLNTLLPSLIEGATGLINGLVSALPSVLDALMGALPAVISGVQSIFTAVVEALPMIMESLVSAFPTLLPLLISGLVNMIVALCANFAQIIQPIIDYLPEIIVSIVNALLSNLPALLEAGGQLLMGLLEGMIALVGNIPEILRGIFNAIVDGIKSLFGIHSPSTVMMEIGRNIMEGLFNGVKNLLGKISELWNTLKTATVNAFNNIKNAVVNAWNTMKTNISTVINAIKSVISNVMNGIKSTVSNVWNGIKSAVSSAVNAVKSVVASVWNGIKSTTSSVFNGIKSTATSVWNGIKTAMTNPIEKARDTIKGIVDKIKGFFSNMKISIPKIKLPHISISGKLSLSPPSVPKLSIDWYKKAMDNPMIMDAPTIFGYNPATNSFMGGGEAGSEVVSGTNTLMNMIKAAVSAQNDAVVYYMQKLIEILADYFPQIVEGMAMPRPAYLGDPMGFADQLAIPMNNALGKLSTRKDRGR